MKKYFIVKSGWNKAHHICLKDLKDVGTGVGGQHTCADVRSCSFFLQNCCFEGPNGTEMKQKSIERNERINENEEH